VCACIPRGWSLCAIRDTHARNRYFHACTATKGQHLRRDTHTRVTRYAIANTSCEARTLENIARACTSRVRGIRGTRPRRNYFVRANDWRSWRATRFSPARYYAGIDNAELVNAFPDRCAPFMDHTRKDPARTSTAPPPSFSQPLCAPRPKFETVAVRRMR